MKGAQTIRLAAIQAESENGQVERNLEKALLLVEEAARQGAELVILPEFLATGYIYTTDIWDAAEPSDGPTVQWLTRHAKRLGIHLGAGFLEVVGDHFLNTFAICDPNGHEAGRVRKQTPALFEAFFTKGEAGPHVIKTQLGLIGVGICYENTLAYMQGLMHDQAVDLMVMPHSAPLPQSSFFVRPDVVSKFEENLKTLASHYAGLLGVPTLMVNKSGPWQSPIPGFPFFRQSSVFPGLSAIADSDGRLKAQMGREKGLIVETVVMDPSLKAGQVPPCRGRWAFGVPRSAEFFRLIEAAGALWYGTSRERKKRARTLGRERT